MSFTIMPSLRSIIALLCLFVALPSLSAAATAKTESTKVLFDEGHGMRFLIEKNGELHLSKLAALFRQHGAEVTSSKERLSQALLADKKGLIISAPFTRYSYSEIDALIHFILEGGRMALMLHIPMPVYNLLFRLNVIASKGIIQESDNIIDNNSRFFRIKVLFPHKLTGELQQFSLHGTWALLSIRPNVEVVAETTPQAWMDLNGNNKQDSTDIAGPFAVLVAGRLGKGEYIVFGDDAIFQNCFITDDNKKLAENLADWLLQ